MSRGAGCAARDTSGAMGVASLLPQRHSRLLMFGPHTHRVVPKKTCSASLYGAGGADSASAAKGSPPGVVLFSELAYMAPDYVLLASTTTTNSLWRFVSPTMRRRLSIPACSETVNWCLSSMLV